MSAPSFHTATPDDVERMVAWAGAEGWNPGLEDARAFHESDPGGFFVAEAEGEVVASISVVNHSDAFAFLGFYICRPDWRGRGIGHALWRHALAHAGGRTVGLDGVAEQEANYARSGFARAGATVRHEGRLAPRPDPRVRPASPVDRAALGRLDGAANGIVRDAFLDAWLTGTGTRRSLVLDHGEGPAGFATIRRCLDGVKIGPIVAATAEDALALAGAAVSELPGDRVIVDVPSANAPLTQRLGALGFRPTFSTARMYRGDPPPTAPSLQAIASMELG